MWLPQLCNVHVHVLMRDEKEESKQGQIYMTLLASFFLPSHLSFMYMYDVYLHLLWCLDLDVSCGIAVHLLKHLVELPVGHNHLHLLLGCAVSMTNDAYHTAQLGPAIHTNTMRSVSTWNFMCTVAHWYKGENVNGLQQYGLGKAFTCTL